MNDWQEKVRDFHGKFGVAIGDTLNLEDRELRAKLILEEAVETVAAMGFDVEAQLYSDPLTRLAMFEGDADDREGNIVEVADGIADLIYVALGAAVSFGINVAPIFDEVHRTNMAKDGGATRGDGKILKPEGWEPPRILGILANQQHIHDYVREAKDGRKGAA